MQLQQMRTRAHLFPRNSISVWGEHGGLPQPQGQVLSPAESTSRRAVSGNLFAPLKCGSVQKDGTEEGDRTHSRPLEQDLGRPSINGYLIITLQESDTKPILQRAVLNAIRLMSHFYDKYFVTLPYFPERKFIGDKRYLCTSFPKKSIQCPHCNL